MSDDDQLMREARLGIEVEAFLGTPVGRYVITRAGEEKEALIEDLINTEPEDVKAATKIRNQILVTNMLLTWLQEAIRMGHAAHHQLKQNEAHE